MFYLLGLLRITKAAITPGTHPHSHSKKTINIEPQPLSNTASGGQKIDNKTLQILMIETILIAVINWTQKYNICYNLY